MNASTGTGAWAGPGLLVPVGVDALVLTDASFNANWSWVLPDYSVVQSFQPWTGPLQIEQPEVIDPAGNIDSFPGVVVRWALPDALTAGGTADQQTGAVTFPAVPNRWLVLRRVAGTPAATQSWIVASDYVGDPAGSPYFASGAATTLGKCWPLEQWPGEAALPPGLGPPLTAVGVGDPTFAAYVPNVQHVFAFFDPLADVDAGQLSYTVCGWYAGQAVDPLSGPEFGTTGWQTEDQWQALMSQLGWSAGNASDLTDATSSVQAWATAHGYATDPANPRTIVPSRTVCHGLVCGVNWQGSSGYLQSGVPQVDSSIADTIPVLTLGHTAIDALATTVSNATAAQGGPGVGSGAPATQLAEDLTALLGNLLPLLDAPDSGAQLALRLQDTWFQQQPGGTRWQVVAAPQAGAPSGAAASTLSAAQASLLDALNAAQRALDTAGGQVASLQWDIYGLWWKLSYLKANPAAVVPLANAEQVVSAALAAKQTATTQALSQWQDALTTRDAAEQAMMASLGGLQLQQVPESPFLRPTNPAVMVQGVGRSYQHGEDGRFTADGSLYCRFTGQTVSGLLVKGGSTPVTAQTLSLSPVTVTDGPPEIGDLVVEAYFLDTGNAHSIAVATSPNSPQPDSVVADQQTLIWAPPPEPTDPAGQTLPYEAGLVSAYGQVATASGIPIPSKVAVEYWVPPWAPLYLDWAAAYYPANSGWTFPASSASTPLAAQTAQWTGTTPADSVLIQGRTLLTPQASDALAACLERLYTQFGDTAEVRPYGEDITEAIAYLGNASVLSQVLSGFNELLLQRDPTLIQQPDLTALGQWLAPQDGPAFTPTAVPAPGSEVPLSPIRAGFLEISELWVVDDFGQYYDVAAAIAANPALGGTECSPDLGPSPQPGWVALRPRLTQASRLLLRFADAADDTLVVGQSATADPVCGWLLPNLADNSLMVYDAAGVLQGELLLTQAQALWLPAPDLVAPGSQNTPPTNPHLKALVHGVLTAASPTAALGDLLATIEAASWATTPSGPDAARLAALIGFPVAVTRAQLLLELAGNPATSQRWADTGTENDGGITTATFPVVLGSASLDDDGVIGFLSDADQGHLSSPYGPSASGYVTTAPLTLTIGQPSAVTLLLHPQSTVHAFSGLLPPVTATLPPQFQLAPVRATEVTFRAGPLLTPPTAVTAPLPALGTGGWAWLQYDGADTTPALPRPLRRADATAGLPDTPPGLRDGWLRLTLGGQPTQLSYTLTPPALSTGQGGPPAASLSITAYNASSSAVTCDSITVTVPTGATAAALTSQPALIRPVSAQPDTWAFQAAGDTQPGTFVATPYAGSSSVPGGSPSVAAGATLTFTLANLSVSPDPGLTVVEILESAQQGAATVTLALEKFSPVLPGSVA